MVYFVVGFLFTLLLRSAEGSGQSCQDIDPGACSTMGEQNTNLCMDPTLATSICPKYCHRCPITCYHCNSSTYDVRTCNTITCNNDEVCMVKEIQSMTTVEHIYSLGCSSQPACDGGRRSIDVMSFSVECCSDDLCNTPALMTTLAPAATSATTTTLATAATSATATTLAPEATSATAQWTTPTFSNGVAVGSINTLDLEDASGLAASRLHPGILYSLNGHGDRPRIYAINATNADIVAIFEITNAKNNDWKDVAVGPCNQDSQNTCIYILDDGDHHNVGKRTVYKVVEPYTINSRTLVPDSLLKYNWTEDNADTLMVDKDANVYIISNVLGGRGMIIMLPPQVFGQESPLFVDSGSYFAMSSTHHDPVAGDISPDGREVLVKNKEAIYYWAPADGDIETALTHPGVKLPYHQETNGQSVCWSADGSAYYTLGEGNYQTLYKYSRQ